MVALGMEVFGPQPSRRRRRGSPPASARCSTRSPTGATNREIGERLYLSPHTIKEHTSSIYRKLEVRNRAEAVQHAQRLGPDRLSDPAAPPPGRPRATPRPGG